MLKKEKAEYKYEAMIIYDKAFENFHSELKKSFEEYDAEICETKFWGLKNIPVKINGHNKGFYIIVTFKCESKAFKDVSKYLRRKKEILRHLIVAV